MLKLVKYEFRKNLPMILTLLGVTAALEVYFFVSYLTDESGHLVASMFLLAVASFAVAAGVFAMGVASYSNELKRKTSYLVFMTPNSTLKVMCSKMLFTLLVGLVFMALLIVLAVVDFPIAWGYFDDYHGIYHMIDALLEQGGISLTQLYLVVGFSLLNVTLEVLSAVGVAYLAVTLSATILQNKKGRGAVSVLLFVGINIGLSRLVMLYVDKAADFDNVWEMLRSAWPSLVQGAVVTVGSVVLSARLLEKRVSL